MHDSAGRPPALRRVLLVTTLTLLAPAAAARVTPHEAARLGAELTPVGAERAGDAAGELPAWSGGLTTPPPCYRGPGARYCDPFPEDRPKLTITARNVEQHAARLTPGQRALFETYPASYQMRVFESRRTAAYPKFYYDATAANAVRAELRSNGEALANVSAGVPFPIPASGREPIWNHKTRFLGHSLQRWNNQFAVTKTGTFAQVKIREDVRFEYNRPDATPASLGSVMLYFLQVVAAPARLAGTVTLVHDTMDQIREPRRAWQYHSGQRRLRRAPNVGYDNPGTASDGLRTNDQLDTFNGATDRYAWRLVGKRLLYVPYNAYDLHSDRHAYRDLLRRGHINQELARYELHRVWVVESITRPGTTHLYKRRTFYIDEDSWQILLVDVYDRRDRLWRVQETHPVIYYDRPLLAPAAEVIYDLQSERYLVQALNNQDPENVERPFPAEHFAPANVAKLVSK